MKKKRLFLIWVPLALAALLLIFSAWGVRAGGEGPSIDWWTVDSGGGQSSGGQYTIQGTFGQADASQVLSGGSYTLQAGFWVGGTPQLKIYLPVVIQ